MLRTLAETNSAGPNQSSAVETRWDCRSSSNPPPSSALLCSRQDCAAKSGRKRSKRESIRKTLPISFSLITRFMVSESESNKRLKKVVTGTPVSSDAFKISKVSVKLRPIGLSTTVGTPA